MAQAGLYINNAVHIRLENVEIKNQQGPAFMIHNADQVEILTCGVGSSTDKKHLIHLNNVQNCSIQSCLPPMDNQDLILMTGDKNRNIISRW